MATRENLSKDVLRRRVRHLFVNRADMRAALRKLVSATFAACDKM
ncbi:hypothetical protein [Streptomyces lydicus]